MVIGVLAAKIFCRIGPSRCRCVVASSGATTSGTPEEKTTWAFLMSDLMFHSGSGGGFRL